MCEKVVIIPYFSTVNRKMPDKIVLKNKKTIDKFLFWAYGYDIFNKTKEEFL